MRKVLVERCTSSHWTSREKDGYTLQLVDVFGQDPATKEEILVQKDVSALTRSNVHVLMLLQAKVRALEVCLRLAQNLLGLCRPFK